jgi:hypothetical protein
MPGWFWPFMLGLGTYWAVQHFTGFGKTGKVTG